MVCDGWRIWKFGSVEETSPLVCFLGACQMCNTVYLLPGSSGLHTITQDAHWRLVMKHRLPKICGVSSDEDVSGTPYWLSVGSLVLCLLRTMEHPQTANAPVLPSCAGCGFIILLNLKVFQLFLMEPRFALDIPAICHLPWLSVLLPKSSASR